MQEDIVETILTDFSRQNTQKEAVDRLFQYLYFNLGEFGVYCGSEDMRSDFLLWLYPKLDAIIDGYNPDRSIFPTYLRMSLTYSWKLFLRRNREQATYDSVAQDDQQRIVKTIQDEQDGSQNYELYAASPPPSYTVLPEKAQSIQETIRWERKRKDIYTRYFLELLCKSCFCINDHLLQTVAGHLGLSVRKVRLLIEEAKELTDKRDTVYNEWVTKRDFYYVRYKSATLQLRKVDEAHGSVIKRLKNRQAYSYARWQGYLKRIQEYTRGPSNRVLAKQLGVSRATINNDLVELKKACYGTLCTYT
ncbi:hypothetical protein [Treponema sp. OMZ 855]|uniref:hypothetical protein n=1 Tax=Treponema sp. OMZ 855 TaxID=1643512 RepID=UPI0020A27E2F|nr:hypothetical protein [Treponema sp. OMZ 855]UTC49693.1 hypothetical protein E4N65_06060 [Treponema sp. OMZ 855]